MAAVPTFRPFRVPRLSGLAPAASLACALLVAVAAQLVAASPRCDADVRMLLLTAANATLTNSHLELRNLSRALALSLCDVDCGDGCGLVWGDRRGGLEYFLDAAIRVDDASALASGWPEAGLAVSKLFSSGGDALAILRDPDGVRPISRGRGSARARVRTTDRAPSLPTDARVTASVASKRQACPNMLRGSMIVVCSSRCAMLLL